MDTWEKSVYAHGRKLEPQQQAPHTMIRREFDWDPNKERINVRKHGIDFETAKEVFGDPLQVTGAF